MLIHLLSFYLNIITCQENQLRRYCNFDGLTVQNKAMCNNNIQHSFQQVSLDP